MAQQKKNTALAVMNDFQIVSRYEIGRASCRERGDREV